MFAAGPHAPGRADLGAEGEAVVRAVAERIAAIQAEKGAPRARREARFAEIYRAHFDHPAIARATLGQVWDRASADERSALVGVLEVYFVKVAAGQWAARGSDRIEVLGSESEGSGVIVASRAFDTRGGRVVSVLWRLRPHDGRLRVRDVIADGASMVLGQRQEIAALYRDRGMSVADVLAALRAKVAQPDPD